MMLPSHAVLDPTIHGRAKTTVAFALPMLHLNSGTWRCSMEHLTKDAAALAPRENVECGYGEGVEDFS